jgi:hypothetical protein
MLILSEILTTGHQRPRNGCSQEGQADRVQELLGDKGWDMLCVLYLGWDAGNVAG